MRSWLVVVAAAVLTSSAGISINLATDLRTNVWAWATVGVLTLAIGVVTASAQQSEVQQGNPRNVVTGNVTGMVVQARDISGPVTLSSDRPNTEPDQQAPR